MGKKISLGIVFSYNENWIGGSYYILNLINALKSLKIHLQPNIYILSVKLSDFEQVKKQTGYRNLKYFNPYNIKRTYVEAIINKIGLLFLRKDIIDKRIEKKIDVIFPASFDECYHNVKKKIFWFPDFQHVYYPDFFSSNEVSLRTSIIRQISLTKETLVLSSVAALNDWNSVDVIKNCKVHVLPFAVCHSDISDIKLDNLLNEYNLSNKYFIVSNQFWIHKNHQVVIDAAKILSSQNIDFQIVMTGNFDDYRSPFHFNKLKKEVVECQLDEQIRFLGFIDRRKQLKLMENAIAVIQPSLFEGWSTVIEDAKLLGTTVIASGIDVHLEQIKENVFFFNPSAPYELAEIIKKLLNYRSEKLVFSYSQNVLKFANDFIKILN